VRGGKMSLDDFMAAESGMSRTPGTCMTMGSASTMACMMEAMGIALPFNATTPAVDAQRRRIAHESGRLIVRMALEDVRLSSILSRTAFENAIRVLGAIGGSTNTVLHLLALAGRLGVPLPEQRAHRHAERPRQDDERGHRGLALARLEPREVGDGQVGPLGHLIERQAGPGPGIPDALGDQRQYLVELHRAMMRLTCPGGKRSCQSLRIGNTGETVR